MYSLIIGLAVLVAAPAKKETPKKEAPTIVGLWNGETGIKGGKPSPPPPGTTMEFATDGTVVLKERGKEIKADYKVDMKKEPAELELSISAGGMATTMRGIFKIDGDTLTICLAFAGDTPTKFESPEGAMTTLITLKRPKKD